MKKGKQSTSGASVQSGLSHQSKIESESSMGLAGKTPDHKGNVMQRPKQPKGSAGKGFKFG